jgi:uncharacterized damage-inducible protein DinB
MPGQAPPIDDEREQLLTFLAQQRYVIRLTAYGLTDDQARATPSASPLSVGGLIKHVASVERSWIGTVLQEDRMSEVDYENNFRLLPNETLADVLARYDDIARETEEVVRGLELDHPVPVPQGVPWFPDDIDAWSVRWVVLHLITETARHAGHADIVRESIDGGTAFPIMAAAEGWPPTPYLQPWVPPTP